MITGVSGVELAVLFILTLCALEISFAVSSSAISLFSPGGQYIMLTFDDGPHSSFTPKILDILREKNVKATFFVYGSKVVSHRSLLARMHAEGHEIANHGWSHHASFTKQVPEQLERMVKQTRSVISNCTGGNDSAASEFIRPPLGNTNPQVNAHITKALGLRVVLWSLDSKDYLAKTAQEVVDSVVPKAKPGDIVLFHDIFAPTVEALPLIIDQLFMQGYEFLTLQRVASYPDDSPK